MNEYVTLYDVVDIRTNKFHSVARVKQKYAKYFVPYVEEE
jgi:hypothetical protein